MNGIYAAAKGTTKVHIQWLTQRSETEECTVAYRMGESYILWIPLRFSMPRDNQDDADHIWRNDKMFPRSVVKIIQIIQLNPKDVTWMQ